LGVFAGIYGVWGWYNIVLGCFCADMLLRVFRCFRGFVGLWEFVCFAYLGCCGVCGFLAVFCGISVYFRFFGFGWCDIVFGVLCCAGFLLGVLVRFVSVVVFVGVFVLCVLRYFAVFRCVLCVFRTMVMLVVGIICFP